MVESIYFLKPAWCGTHFAGLWPEQGFQPVTRATALRRWFVTPCIAVLIATAVVGLIWLGYGADWTGFQAYTSPAVDGSRTFTRAKTLWDWLQLLIVPVVI